MSERVFTHLGVGKRVRDLNGLTGVITEIVPVNWGCKIIVKINGIELEYHPRDFQTGGIIVLVDTQEQAL